MSTKQRKKNNTPGGTAQAFVVFNPATGRIDTYRPVCSDCGQEVSRALRLDRGHVCLPCSQQAAAA